jgi:ATPase, YjeE family
MGNVFIARHFGGEDLWEMQLLDAAATDRLAFILAQILKSGDLITLSGEVGAGKTTLARSILRVLAQDPEIKAPSPTFTIIQDYETLRGPVIHADFYRLSGPSDLIEIDWDDLTENSITLVEWPDIARDALSPDRLEIFLDLDPISAERTAFLIGRGSFRQRLSNLTAVENLLDGTSWQDAVRIPIQGDASTRIYERLQLPDGKSAILMIAPKQPDGPPIRRGRPYSAIAKLAESVHAFIAIDQGLLALGLSAPRIYLKNLEAGLLVLEDLGMQGITRDGAPIPERYHEAVHVLTKLHRVDLPHQLPITASTDYQIPAYDQEALTIETELLLDWYVPHIRGHDVSGSARSEFGHLWTKLLKPVLTEPLTWTMRDYHSPNLFWIEERESIRRIGLIDFQDTVLGSSSYDLVSLLQDARITIPADLEMQLLAFYGSERKAANPAFNISSFAETYAIMGAQRATKILGIFARLDKRDSKPQYLAHIPRLETYLVRNLNHPALANLKNWYTKNLPHLFESKS